MFAEFTRSHGSKTAATWLQISRKYLQRCGVLIHVCHRFELKNSAFDFKYLGLALDLTGFVKCFILSTRGLFSWPCRNV